MERVGKSRWVHSSHKGREAASIINTEPVAIAKIFIPENMKKDQ
jgi:hypothetical protein